MLCRLPQAGCQLRYAYVTQRGFYPEARQKSNQDAVFAKHHFGDGPENLLFAVYDGHGSNGTLCAQFSKEQVLPSSMFPTDRSELLLIDIIGSVDF